LEEPATTATASAGGAGAAETTVPTSATGAVAVEVAVTTAETEETGEEKEEEFPATPLSADIELFPATPEDKDKNEGMDKEETDEDEDKIAANANNSDDVDNHAAAVRKAAERAARAQDDRTCRIHALANALGGMYCPCPGFAYNSLTGEKNVFVSDRERAAGLLRGGWAHAT
jgi:hypothetical protein